MKIWTLGTGFIASHLPYPQITGRLTPNQQDMYDLLSQSRGGVLINCLGRTGRPNVDQCEIERSKTYEANVVLPLMIAEWCEKNDTHLIHLGSGCIYYGDSPCKGHITSSPDPGWRETDLANPQSYYSKSKYACDLMLGQMPHVTTLRLRMPVSDKDTHRNLINKLRGYKQVIDIPNSMTFMDDLTRCIDWAAANRPGGIFHVTNPRPLTAARIMQEYQKYMPEHQFDIIDEHQLDQMVVAKRSNCILSTQKLNQAGFTMTDTEEALVKCMANYIENMWR